MSDHKSERGALLARLEARCVQPGQEWIVEGYRIHGGQRRWQIDDERWFYYDFTEALRVVAERVDSDR